MTDEEFMELARATEKYLSKGKVFVQNPARMYDVIYAREIAKHLFPEAKINIKHDPLQTGALILEIEDFDLTVRETELFNDIVGKADNFEIYAIGDDKVKIAILFLKAMIKVYQEK